MGKNVYIIDESIEYGIASATVRLAEGDYPGASAVEIARKVLDAEQYALWKDHHDREEAANKDHASK